LTNNHKSNVHVLWILKESPKGTPVSPKVRTFFSSTIYTILFCQRRA